MEKRLPLPSRFPATKPPGTTWKDNSMVSPISPSASRHASLPIFPVASCPLFWVPLLLILAPFAFASAQSSTSAKSNEPKRVLILLQEDLTWPIFREVYENARDTLRAGEPG